MEMCPSRMPSGLWIGTLVLRLILDSLSLKYTFRSVPDFHAMNRAPGRLIVVILVHLVNSLRCSF